ncbi:unnamed protein product [Cuscuta campestris]|uniref:K Homology domain-containing protein n=2 Tax=Cuscuta sect. Cleistogrammica TaxID=1824901 RepID=A0A484MXM9_9ASTE|nr:hypothetical protein DM860_016276 [Cuscuta australis]VFQ93570.1 unnamed protein product [Cuscuta campestris]
MIRRPGEHRRVEAQPHSPQMNFRLLCHIDTAGGVIGNSGALIKHLECQTGCQISFEKPLVNCAERVINVIGDASAAETNFTASEDVSAAARGTAAQEGLFRVFERILELEGKVCHGEGAVGCRLLCQSFQVKALIGKRGRTIDAIRRISGAKIKVLNKEHLPDCASTDEELVQIMGGILSVKRALVHVSQCLQDCAMGRRPMNMPSAVLRNENHVDFSPHPSSLMPSSLDSAFEKFSIGHTVANNDDRVFRPDEENTKHKVSFRLLCALNSGRRVGDLPATTIHALEKETGASISFSPPIHGSQYRVVMISSLEQIDPLYPYAQMAVIRVFEKYMEECILVSGLRKGATVTAKIVVTSDELKCMGDRKGQVGADISSTSGVEIQLTSAELPQNVLAENDKVIQIVGEYFNVKTAIFQVTAKLRQNFFSSLVYRGVKSNKHYRSASSMRPKGSHNITQLNLAPQPYHISDLSTPAAKNHLRFIPNLGGPHKLLLNKQINGSVDANGATYRTDEVVVPAHKFEMVYGLEGTNLVMLKQSSGAEVTVQDPQQGENSGKVMISGTSEQILVAKSLLQSFICIEPLKQ